MWERDQEIIQVRSYCSYPSCNNLFGFRKIFQPPSKRKTEKGKYDIQKYFTDRTKVKIVNPSIPRNHFIYVFENSNKIGGNKHFKTFLFSELLLRSFWEGLLDIIVGKLIPRRIDWNYVILSIIIDPKCGFKVFHCSFYCSFHYSVSFYCFN